MRLKRATSIAWTSAVLRDFDAFLADHAACERKASAAALALVSHYPDRTELVRACVPLAVEELSHFRDVFGWIARRGGRLAPDTRSPYISGLTSRFRDGSEAYFLDRLIVAAIAEARGCERFALVAGAVDDGELARFYRDLARAEARHQDLYIDLAKIYFDEIEVGRRLEELLEAEAELVEKLPVRAALY